MSDFVDRRKFLKRLAFSGALIATADLPVLAMGKEDGYVSGKDDIFGGRGGRERLSLSYAVVKIGLEHPFSVLHISDTHLAFAGPDEGEDNARFSAKRTRTFGGFQQTALRDSLEWARGHVDYIIHTGDLIDFRTEENYSLVKKYFGEGMTGSLGNHEYSTCRVERYSGKEQWEEFGKKVRQELEKVYPFDTSIHSQVVNGVNFVTLDNCHGYVVREQVERFKQEVKRGLPIVLCMHVPFFTEGIWRVSRRFWSRPGKYSDSSLPEPSGDYLKQLTDSDTKEFISYLKKQKLLKAILAGHEHITFEERFSPTAMQYLVAGNFLFAGREILFI